MKTLAAALALVALSSAWLPAHAAETPETILIRSSLANDLSGRRRGNAELVLSAYHEEFFAWDAHGNLDPRAWTPLHGSLDELADSLTTDLSRHRYETERTLPFIHVRLDQAMVTSVDSGRVIDRSTGAARDIHVRRFWTFRKVEDEWLITGLIHDTGDTAIAAGPRQEAATPIAELLRREQGAWEQDDPDGVAGVFAEELIGIDGFGNADPAKWKIIFSDGEELQTWVEKRLGRTEYEIDRDIVFATVDPAGSEALALTREQLTTRHDLGDVVHETSRYVLWTLSRRTGQWRITNMCYDIGVPD